MLECYAARNHEKIFPYSRAFWNLFRLMQAATATFSVVSLNLHKGLSPLNRRVIIREVRHELHALAPELLFLQEVQDAHTGHAARFADWPAEAQSRFLAGGLWPEVHYGRNAVYRHGHHGNAILSRFPVESVSNDDMSMHRFESRGLLHAVVRIGTASVHCLCMHLGLTHRGRVRQIEFVLDTLGSRALAGEAVIIAGDFNDWRGRSPALMAAHGLADAFAAAGGRTPCTFPGYFPLLRLDRIFSRGLRVRDARVLSHLQRLSDHSGITARFALP